MSELAEPLDLATFVQPLKDTIDKLDREISDLETLVRGKREQRAKYRGVLKGLDPESVKPLYKQNGAGKNGSKKKGVGLGEPKIEMLKVYLTENKERLNEGEGFFASGLCREEDFPFNEGQQSQVSRALLLLQERGVIRLDHIGTRGGTKFYKVV